MKNAANELLENQWETFTSAPRGTLEPRHTRTPPPTFGSNIYQNGGELKVKSGNGGA